MCEAVKNMLANALRHGQAPIQVGVGIEDGDAEIWVKDAGEGAPEEVLSRIGQRFERSAASSGNSAGLGLSIIKSVAGALNGSFRMERTESGFRATLALPVDTSGEQP